MKEDQAEREPIDHDRFRRLLEQTLRRLVRGAHDQGITLPAGFTFGFQPYVEGMRPEEEDLERLVDQLRSVYLLCQVLYTSGVKEIVSIERTVFEEGAQVTEPDAEYDRRRRRRTEPEVEESSTDLVRDPDGLFTRETYVLTYRAGDEANWLVLDSLAKGSPFVVITQMDIVNSARPVVVPPKTAPAPEAAAPAAAAGTAGWLAPGARNAAAGAMRQEETVLPRDLRVVAGRENPLVRLQVDLYEFAGEEAPAEEGEESP